jgi:peptide/nickel transport system substrate-binding protein
VEVLDPLTVKFVFTQPTPYWLMTSAIIPRHIFEPYKGAKSREAPNNLKPVGTGPYRFVEFKPGDLLKAEINPNYHVANRPFFDTLEIKGGGDAVSAARAVLQTGEYDYAAEVGGVEDDVLRRLEQGGKGRVVIAFGGRINHVQLNQTDPWTEVDGERSSVKTVHPFLTDPAVRGALALLVDRAGIQEQILGRTGQVAPNWINAPERFRSKNTRWEFSIDKANQLLDAGGWKRGADGVRAKDGKRLKVVFQAVTNAVAQKVQAVIKQAAAKAGIEMELKSVVASSFYSSNPANPDTYTHFYADLQLITYLMGPPDPERLMRVFTSWEVASKENNWQKFNVWRWRNEEYDRLYRAAETEMDPVKRAALFIRMNDLVVQNGVVIPIVLLAKAAAISNRLRGIEHNPYELDFWNLPFWYREG